MSTLLATAPPFSIRTTIRPIILVIGILIVAIWALVGFSLVTSRQAAMDVTRWEARNLMIAFREEIGHILRGIQGQTNLIADFRVITLVIDIVDRDGAVNVVADRDASLGRADGRVFAVRRPADRPFPKPRKHWAT